MKDGPEMSITAATDIYERQCLDNGLKSLADPALDPLFWSAVRLGAPSAWWRHVPFAHWVVSAARPNVLVELGTHAGVSYSAFCQAVKSANLPTRCHAVDTWKGDEHSGNYGEAIFDEFNLYNDQHFSAFSTLIRATFDEALGKMEDASIDLLHIDGLHTYEAVKRDYENWLPKLSDRAVVLFHDINERSGDFGVWRLWEELEARHPSFTFLHGFGLGVLAVGTHAPDPILALCRLEDPREIAAVRTRFAWLGERWHTATCERMLSQRVGTAEAAMSRLPQVESALAAAEAAMSRLPEIESALAQARSDAAQRTVAEARSRDIAARRTLDARREAIAASVAAREIQAENERLRQELQSASARALEAAAVAESFSALAKSTVRLSASRLQNASARMPNTVRRGARGVAKLVWWTATLQLSAKLQERRRLIAFYEDAARRSSGEQPVQPPVVRKDPAIRSARQTVPRPLRRAAEFLPNSVRRGMRGAAKLTWWTVTMQLRSKLRARRRYFESLKRATATAESMSNTAVPYAPRDRAAVRLVYISGEPDTPGHVYRIERYAASLRILGGEVSWMRVDEIPGRMAEIKSADILVIWRAPWDDNIAASIDAARESGVRIVFDVDDLMVDPDIAKVSVIDGIRSQFLTETQVKDHYSRVRQTMFATDFCFTTTSELAFHLRWAEKTTHVLPNGFDQAAHDLSRVVSREWRRNRTDNLIRIGYAGGSRTHQRDLGLAIEPLARLLQENPDCRLVLFRTPDGQVPLIDIEEFPALRGLEDRIEWRPLQPLASLPREMARFDINLAPLEYGNPFCEAKSELKFFEAALVDVPTIASPTGPFRRAIDHGKTGYLAATANDWYVYLKRLAEDAALRQRIAHDAYHAALAAFGPMNRTAQFARTLDQVLGGIGGASAFALESFLSSRPRALPKVFDSDIIFEHDSGGRAEVTVVIPLYNYENYVVDALNSVLAQTLQTLDLVIVDGFSTDRSLSVADAWARQHAARFNRIAVLQNRANYGLAFCRNSGFDAAESTYVLPLDADNRLAPDCCEALLATIKKTSTAYVYPTIQHFGASSALMCNAPYDPQHFAPGNYVDAMALVSKEAWAIVGGYDHIRSGWEDYDFWCRLAEQGLRGEWLPRVLAYYRVHATSMMTVQTTVPGNYKRLMAEFNRRHPWVSLIDEQTSRRVPSPDPHLPDQRERSRLDALLPILRCPVTKEKLTYSADRKELVSVGGLQSWPIRKGRPVLSLGVTEPQVHPDRHISNELPEPALDLIRRTSGLILNLSAGGSREKFDHVVEVEYAIFRHTDVVADAHVLPFDDGVFEAIVVMNAFEHYHDPSKVAAELLRILKPDGRVFIRTAFMQPLHERPWHFFNCTRYGLAEWFKDFETEQLHVSDNFCPNHSIAWLASEAEAALRAGVSARSADAFMQAPIGALIDLWRDPAKRNSHLWTDFQKLSQPAQEVMAAGFEFLGRKPMALPDLTGKRERTQ